LGTEKEAVAGVCIGYCERGDPTVEAAYQKYKATPKGRADKTSRTMSIAAVPEVKEAYDRCKINCDRDVASKKIAVSTTCDK